MLSKSGTVLGFDYGERRIGVALGNEVTRTAQPLAVIQNVNTEHRFSEIKKLLDVWQPVKLAVGLPVQADGSEQKMTRLAKRFGNQLTGRFNLPVYWVDERYSTMAAELVIKNSKSHAVNVEVDAQAASIILQQYFDEQPID